MTDIRHYETTIIFHPDLDDAGKNAAMERLSGIIASFGGEVLRVDEWGRRKLAYRIRKQTRGLYIYVRYTATGDAIAELERIMRIMDPVMKYLTVKVDVEFEKDQAEARERRELRLSQMAASRSIIEDDDDNDVDED